MLLCSSFFSHHLWIFFISFWLRAIAIESPITATATINTDVFHSSMRLSVVESVLLHIKDKIKELKIKLVTLFDSLTG